MNSARLKDDEILNLLSSWESSHLTADGISETAKVAFKKYFDALRKAAGHVKVPDDRWAMDVLLEFLKHEGWIDYTVSFNGRDSTTNITFHIAKAT